MPAGGLVIHLSYSLTDIKNGRGKLVSTFRADVEGRILPAYLT